VSVVEIRLPQKTPQHGKGGRGGGGVHFAGYWYLLWVLVDWIFFPENSILHFCYEIWE